VCVLEQEALDLIQELKDRIKILEGPSTSPTKSPTPFPDDAIVMNGDIESTLHKAVDNYLADSEMWRDSTDCDDGDTPVMTCGAIYGYVKR
jgi:hypothetical protein